MVRAGGDGEQFVDTDQAGGAGVSAWKGRQPTDGRQRRGVTAFFSMLSARPCHCKPAPHRKHLLFHRGTHARFTTLEAQVITPQADIQLSRQTDKQADRGREADGETGRSRQLSRQTKKGTQTWINGLKACTKADRQTGRLAGR